MGLRTWLGLKRTPNPDGDHLTGSVAYRRNKDAIWRNKVPRKYQRLIDHIPGDRILELGSAEGVLALLLAQRKQKVIAVERHVGRHVEALRLQDHWRKQGFEVDRCELVLGDITDRLELLRNVDTFVAVRSIYHLGDNTQSVLNEVGQHVENVVLCGNRNRASKGALRPDDSLGSSNFYASVEGMTSALEEAGYSIVKTIVDHRDPIVIGRKRIGAASAPPSRRPTADVKYGDSADSDSYIDKFRHLFKLATPKTRRLRRNAFAAFKRKDWSAAVQHYESAIAAYGAEAPVKVQLMLNRARLAQKAEEVYRANRVKYPAVADPEKVIWVPLENLRFKVRGANSRSLGRNDISPGDWDLERWPIDTDKKYRAVLQHFRDGVKWEETDLFRAYETRLREGPLRECTTTAELAKWYDEKMNDLYENIKQRGFRLPDDRRAKINDLPHVHIARDGEILFANSGNHRLAIACLLKIEHIPCVVYTRHADWQAIRERAHASQPEVIEALLGPLVDHPDLVDILEGKSLRPARSAAH